MSANTRDLPSHVLSTAGGLRTNFNPQENQTAAWIRCVNMDSFEEFNALGKIPGSERVSDPHPGPVVSLHYFEYTSLEGIRRREPISLSAGTLRRVNPDKTLTVLASGFVSESLAAVVSGNQAYFTSENQRGFSTGGMKWDGVNARAWGLVAPGSAKSVKLALDVQSAFMASTDASKSNDIAVKRDAVGSIRVDKLGTTTSEAYIEDSGLGLNLSAGGDLLFIWLFVPAGAIQKLAISGAAAEVRYGGAALTNSDVIQWSVGELVQGWNLLSWDRTAPDSITGAGATLSAVDTIRLRLVFNASSQTQSGFRWDSLYGTDDGSPLAALGAAGLVNAAVRYRVTYVDETGEESNLGPASNSVTPASQQVNLSGVPVSADPKVIARRIYRDKAGDGIYLFVAQVDNNVDTTFTDNVPEASLGVEQPPIAGDSDYDRSPPENFRDVAVWNNRAWGISADNPSVIVPSNINDLGGYPIVEQIVYEDELIALEPHALGLLVYGSDRIYLQTGSGTAEDPIRVVETTNQSGTNGRRAVAKTKGLNVTVRESEVFLIGDPFDPWQINFPVLDQFKALDPGKLRDMHVILDRSRFRICFFGKSGAGGSDRYDTVKSYQYGTSGQFQVTGDGPGVDPQDLRQGAWRDIALAVDVDPQCSEMVERDADREELWVGGGDGYIYRLFGENRTSADWAVGLGAEPVEAELEWSAVPLGASRFGRGRPRYLHLSGVFETESTWRVRLRFLSAPEGQLRKEVEFDMTLGPGESDPIVPIPQRLVAGHFEFCQVRIRNAALGETGLFRHAELFYTRRGDFRGPRAA